jgi:NAD(P)-dependent dehydrogenase (short-subunit alcohol dehydrogenase family)
MFALDRYGWERQIATNHFGHFYLVQLLRDKMVAKVRITFGFLVRHAKVL